MFQKCNSHDNILISLGETDGLISRALLTGNIASAVEICIQKDRWADALVLAQAGGLPLLQKTQKLYFKSTNTHSTKVSLNFYCSALGFFVVFFSLIMTKSIWTSLWILDSASDILGSFLWFGAGPLVRVKGTFNMEGYLNVLDNSMLWRRFLEIPFVFQPDQAPIHKAWAL